jgi:hypothetical protein
VSRFAQTKANAAANAKLASTNHATLRVKGGAWENLKGLIGSPGGGVGAVARGEPEYLPSSAMATCDHRKGNDVDDVCNPGTAANRRDHTPGHNRNVAQDGGLRDCVLAKLLLGSWT